MGGEVMERDGDGGEWGGRGCGCVWRGGVLPSF